MKTTYYIQFSMEWERLQRYFKPDIANLLQKNVNIAAKFPSLTLYNEQEEFAISLLNTNIIAHDRHVIRLIRKIIRVEEDDIKDNDVYEFIPGAEQDEELKLKTQPSKYYTLHTECQYCGRYKWIQHSDLQLSNSMSLDIDEVESGEIVISERLKDLFFHKRFEGFSYRSVVGERNIWQLISKHQATVKRPNEYIREKDICSYCGKPRIVVYEDTNGVELFNPPYDQPRIERTPTLFLQNWPGELDFSKTDAEFGTLGRLPEGSPVVAAENFTHKTSKPKWVVSGRMCKFLFKNQIKGFQLAPAKFTNLHRTVS